MTLLSLDNGNDTELNITIRSFKIRFKSTFLQERPSLAFIVEHELPPEMRFKVVCPGETKPKTDFCPASSRPLSAPFLFRTSGNSHSQAGSTSLLDASSFGLWTLDFDIIRIRSL